MLFLNSHVYLRSIAYGVIAGIVSYTVLNTFVWLVAKATGDRIVPPNLDDKEQWVIPPGGIVPAWM